MASGMWQACGMWHAAATGQTEESAVELRMGSGSVNSQAANLVQQVRQVRQARQMGPLTWWRAFNERPSGVKFH